MAKKKAGSTKPAPVVEPAAEPAPPAPDAAAEAAATAAKAEAQQAADRKVAKEVATQAGDLADDGGVVAPKGTEEHPTRSDGLDYRKAIFKKSDKQREDAQARAAEADPGTADMVRRFEMEASGEARAIEDGDTGALAKGVTPEPDDQGAPAEEGGESVAKPASEDYTHSQPDPDAPVEVVINGQSRKIPQRDIDAAGGQLQYERIVAAEETAEKDRVFESRLASLEQQRLEPQLQAQGPSQPETPGPTTRDQPPPRGNGRGETSEFADLDEKALFELVSSGDPKVAPRALDEWVARSVAQRLPAVASPEPSPEASEPPAEIQPPVSQERTVGGRPVPTEQVAQIDEMLHTDFAPIMAHNPSLQRLQSIFSTMMADPVNKHRRPADIARQAADYIGERAPGNVADKLVARQQQKAAMPKRPPMVKGDPKPEPKPAGTLSKRSSIVAQIRAARGQPESAPIRKPIRTS